MTSVLSGNPDFKFKRFFSLKNRFNHLSKLYPVFFENMAKKNFLINTDFTRYISEYLIKLIRPADGIASYVPFPASHMGDLLSFFKLRFPVPYLVFRAFSFCYVMNDRKAAGN